MIPPSEAQPNPESPFANNPYDVVSDPLLGINQFIDSGGIGSTTMLEQSLPDLYAKTFLEIDGELDKDDALYYTSADSTLYSTLIANNPSHNITARLVSLYRQDSESLPALWRDPDVMRQLLSVMAYIEIGYLRAEAISDDGSGHQGKDKSRQRAKELEELVTALQER